MSTTEERANLDATAQKKMVRRVKGIYSVYIPIEYEEIYRKEFLHQFKSFSAFIRSMVETGLNVQS
jgi:hypothetical protein